MLTADTLRALLDDDILPSRMPDVELLARYLKSERPHQDPICLSFGETWSQVAPGLAERLASDPIHSHGYQLSQYGLPALRLRVRDQIRDGHRLPETSQPGRDYEVAVAWNGTRSAMFDFGRLIRDQDAPADQTPVAVVAGPSWDYEGVFSCQGYRVRYHRLRPERGFQPCVDELEALCADVASRPDERLALLVVNAQHNPTAVNWDPKFVAASIAAAAERGAAVLIDDAYYAVHDDDVLPTSALSILLDLLPDLPAATRRRWLAVRSFGKQFHSNGWGIGALTAGPQTLDLLVNRYRLHNSLMYGGSYQHAMNSWLADDASQEFLARQRTTFRQRRKMIGEFLTDRLGYPDDQIHLGECSSYLMFAVPREYILSTNPAERFRRDCFAATGVLLAPVWPWPFSADEDAALPYVRMFIGPATETIHTALTRMEAAGIRHDMTPPHLAALGPGA
ncbi:MAG: aminotransferase class I/II-fold pyridoxal phosphate-dependent enzyme [Stackebrandtia sp.]